ncbi:MAG: Ribosomal protein S1 [Chloroflexi bacterium AL-W]|nr:Ribosomal protein S1 [Chloroflexi bacterium AL-N1]NOK65761.1 Ribosomal protein S1 [Chloroflexi bacterium AL-N10]NOK74298.1 Ribosomal protein S1 [Chloroflexi bacterium AL-N5]NOK80794.1 Ribosomal protein S1 [Chloroflexi bacterium AL-W]NOK88556.1 Ribosomal protein S1 [Chloroflexi bacterium AL-N15]
MEQPDRVMLDDKSSSAINGSSEENHQLMEDAEDRALMEQFLEDPAHDYRNLQYGDTVDGTIIRIYDDEILVNVGAKAEGVVPVREMQSLPPEDRDALKSGDTLLVFVIQSEEREGRAILSIDRARQEKSWRHLQHVHDNNEVIDAKVINYNKGGLLVNLDGVRGFVPASQVSIISRGPETQKQSDMAKLVGTDLPLKIIEINRNRNRLILSERQAVQEVREGRKGELLSALDEGDVRNGVVTSVCDFGAFVDIGGADGLVHLSEISWSRVKHPSEILQPGENVKVQVLGIDNDRKRIALSIKRTQEEPWLTVSERYQLGQMVEATVTQLASFGAFARIEDGIEGLIHVSEMGDDRIQHPREVVQEGTQVQVRIIRIDPVRKRIGLSMRQPGEGGTPEDEADVEEKPDVSEEFDTGVDSD